MSGYGKPNPTLVCIPVTLLRAGFLAQNSAMGCNTSSHFVICYNWHPLCLFDYSALVAIAHNLHRLVAVPLALA
jgi:hypothetical protein